MIQVTTTQRNMLAVAALTGVGLLAHYWLRQRQEAKQAPEPKQQPLTIVQQPKEGMLKKKKGVFPLQEGSTGKEVERLQIWLLRNHGWQGEITKTFDAQTLKLVNKALQQDTVDKKVYEQHQMGIPIHKQIHNG